MAERQLPKLNVAGSIPVSRSKRNRLLEETIRGMRQAVLRPVTPDCFRRLQLFFVLILLASGWGSEAQGSLSLRHQAWSTEDGLPQNSVHQVLQGSDGYIWAATEGGLARFDGVVFRVFNHWNESALVSDDVCCLANDSEGNLWAGTADGLLRRRKGRFERFGEKEGLPSASIRGLAMAGRTVLILAGSSLVAWRGGQFEAVAGAPSGIRGMQPTGDGGALLLGDGFAVLWQEGRGVVRSFARVASIGGVTSGLGGAFWSFTATTVTVIDGVLSRSWEAGSVLPGSRVESLFVDHRGVAWVGTNDGLAMLSKGSPAVVPVEALRGNSVLQTIEDREGNYWIGTETSGLHVLRALKFRTETGLADKALTAVVQGTDGAVWVGTRADGLRRVHGDLIEEPAKAERLTSPVILSLATGAHGGVWAGTPDGLNQVEASGGVRRITSAEGLPDDYIQALLAAPDGSVWAGTRHGLVHLRGKGMEVLTTADGLSGDLIGALYLARDGDLWVGTSGGLCRISKGRITAYGSPRGIVTAMTQDESGALWIAMQGNGLSRFARGEFREVKAPSVPETVSGLSSDGLGYLWLRDERGVERISLAGLNRCAEDGAACDTMVRAYGVADGLPTSELVAGGSPVMWRMANGELWFSTRRGAAIADPAHLPLNTVAPPVVIERFLVDESPLEITGEQIEIPAGRVRYTMDYAALSFMAPSEVRYRFKLEGLDKGWTEAGGRRSATYTNLPARWYTFRVQGMNNDGIWNETGASLQFRVVPPFYRRWWFLVLAALGTAGVAIFVYRLRLRRLQVRFDAVLHERNRVAREIHDTLAQDFVGVSLQLDMVSQMLRGSKVEAALEQVRQARQLVTDGLADARRSIWELRANVTDDSLPARLGKVVERYSGEALPVRLRIGGAFRRLNQKVEDQVLRIAQESLSNVQRHSGAGAASVALVYGEDMLVLTVEDDGRGFAVSETERLEGHYGVSGMKERAAVIGSRLEIASAPGEGTKIVLSTPLSGMKER